MTGARETLVTVEALTVRLCRLACDVDETVQQLGAAHLTDGEAALLTAPVLHLTNALEQMDQVVYEVEKLDQRPRLQRLEAA